MSFTEAAILRRARAVLQLEAQTVAAQRASAR